ncbi:MFS transporter [Streptomyces sp. DSM 44917]|uniref:MFS transporter n=1 Tax=Streptomyces boetiae TaxID=3075541 RepID=A0ABU2LBK9_9ACTN|nr:MFS transporter [Streptomyces sp. DSM 44917]MDT0308638.1 MFS transporter [Streptomyces sp. DSM 44917]
MTESLIRTSPTGTPPAAPPGAAGLGALGLCTVLIGSALPQLDFFIVNVALSSVGRDLDASPALLELVVAGYSVAYAVLLVLGGRLGDTYGRRRLFLTGLAAFGLTSLACGLAPDAWTLIAARVGQGAASALMVPQVLAIIQATTTGQRRARAIGMYAAVAGLAMVAGQILGGLLTAADLAGSGWRSVFLLNIPVVLAGLVLVWRVLPESRAERPAPVDLPGTALLAAALTTLLVPLTEGRAAGWPAWSWVLLALFPVAALAFVAVERRAERSGSTVPLVPPSLLRTAGMRRAMPPMMLCIGGFGGFMFVVALTFQEGLRFGPVRAGTALVPYALAFFAASLAGPRLAARFGPRLVTTGGLVQAVGVVALVAAVLRGWPDLGFLDLAPGLAVAGFGQGLQLPLLMRLVLADIPPEQAGVGGGAMATAQQSAIALGVALLGALFLALADSPGAMREALAITLTVQLAAVAVTTALSLRLGGGRTG